MYLYKLLMEIAGNFPRRFRLLTREASHRVWRRGYILMAIKRTIASLLAAAAATLAVSSAANAATVVAVGTPDTGTGAFFTIKVGQTSLSPVINSTFGAYVTGPSTAFDYQFDFIIDNSGVGSGNLSYSYNGPTEQLTINDVKVNGTSYASNILGSATTGYALLVNNIAITAGKLNTIEVIGQSASTNVSTGFSGNANFRLAAVPEPASWAMMIGGMGLIGGALRRRNTALRLA